MPKVNEALSVGDKCIILIDEVPTVSLITRKVTSEELVEDKVVTNIQYFVQHRGNTEPYLGKIFKSKDALLSDFASPIKNF